MITSTVKRHGRTFVVVVGAFSDEQSAERARAAIQAAVDFPDVTHAGRRKLRFEDGTMTKMGSALIWLEDAGDSGLTSAQLAAGSGFSKEYAGVVLRRLADAGYASRKKIERGRVVYFRRKQ